MITNKHVVKGSTIYNYMSYKIVSQISESDLRLFVSIMRQPNFCYRKRSGNFFSYSIDFPCSRYLYTFRVVKVLRKMLAFMNLGGGSKNEYARFERDYWYL